MAWKTGEKILLKSMQNILPVFWVYLSFKNVKINMNMPSLFVGFLNT